jgi:hypothetical protein
MSESAVPSGNTPAPAAPEAATPEVAVEGAEPQSNELVHLPGGEDAKGDEVANQAKIAEEIIRKKFKVKIDDLEAEVSEDELKSGYQRAKASQKRFEEAARLKKQAEQQIDSIRKNPIQALAELGIDVRGMSEEYLAKQLQLEQLSPEQRKLMEMEEKLRSYEEQDKAKKQKEEQDQHAKLMEHYEQEYTNGITAALNTSGLPKTPYTVKRMAQYMARALDNGYEVKPQDVVSYVKEDYMNDFKEFFATYEGDALMDILGKQVVDKIRKAELAKVKGKAAPATPTATKTVAQTEPGEPKPKKKMTMAEFREFMNKD